MKSCQKQQLFLDRGYSDKGKIVRLCLSIRLSWMHEKKGNCVHGAQRLLDPQTLTEYLEQPPFFHKLSRCLRVSASRSSLRFLGYRYVSSPLIRPGSDSHFLQIVNVQMHSSTVLYFSSLQQHSCKIASPLKRAKEYREIVIRGSKKEDIVDFIRFFFQERIQR